MKIYLEKVAMDAVSYVALYSAEIVANFGCWFVLHQKPEPEAVRKLRKF